MKFYGQVTHIFDINEKEKDAQNSSHFMCNFFKHSTKYARIFFFQQIKVHVSRKCIKNVFLNKGIGHLEVDLI